MKRHLPRGRWTQQMKISMSWDELSEIALYRYRTATSHGSKKAAQRRIHKIERQRAKQELRDHKL